jgi:hypothetical protein
MDDYTITDVCFQYLTNGLNIDLDTPLSMQIMNHKMMIFDNINTDIINNELYKYDLDDITNDDSIHSFNQKFKLKE